MDSQILGWVDLAMDTAEVVAVVAVLLVLFRLDRNIAALLRVIRRMDRKAASPTSSERQRQAKLNEASLRLPRDRQPQQDRAIAD